MLAVRPQRHPAYVSLAPVLLPGAPHANLQGRAPFTYNGAMRVSRFFGAGASSELTPPSPIVERS